MTATLSLTEDQVLQALATFIADVTGLPAGAIVIGQDNRVAAPMPANYVVMTPVSNVRLSTNVTGYVDGVFTPPFPPVGGTRNDMTPSRVTVQIDVHGPQSQDNARMIETLFRSDYGIIAFGNTGFDVTPLFAGEMHQAPFVNGEQQVENVWQVDVSMQCNPVVTTEQDFADQLDAGLISVQAQLGDLVILNGTVCTPDGKPFFYRGWNWGAWGTFTPQDALDAKAQGATMIRIPLRWYGLYSNPGIDSRNDLSLSTARIDPSHIAILDSMVLGAFNAGIRVQLFLDGQCCQNGLQDNNQIAYCDPQGIWPGGHNIWADPALKALYKGVLVYLARRYERYVSIIEVQPEPNPNTFTNDDITDMYVELLDTVRQAIPNSKKLYVVGARSYSANNVKQAYNKAWTDVIYAGNGFMFSNPTDPVADLESRLQTLLDFSAQKGVPVQVDQFGVNTSDDDATFDRLQALIAWLNANKLPWLYWSYKAHNQNSQGYEPLYMDGNGGWITNVPKLNAITAGFTS